MIKKIKKFSFLIGFIILFTSYSCGESSQNSKQAEVDALIEKQKKQKRMEIIPTPWNILKDWSGFKLRLAK